MTRTRGALATVALLAAGVGVVVAASGADRPAAAAGVPTPATAKVERGSLSAVVFGTGTLTYRARPDGSPYTVVNQATGIYTQLPTAGDKVGCGQVLYRVDNRPVVLLCGSVPAYRELRMGVSGPDVRQLNRNLHGRRAGDAFTTTTERALQALQRRTGTQATGALDLGDAVFLPEPIRVAKVAADVGGPARPSTPVLSATSDKLHVRVDLEASEQSGVKTGDRVQITLPGNTPLKGKVAGFGRVAQAGQGAQATAATIPTFIDLDDARKAAGFEQAPVDVDITTKGVDDALSVPVTALVGKAGGGFGVERVGSDGRRDLVGVRLGLFDTGAGRVEVEGDLHAGDAVAVPSV